MKTKIIFITTAIALIFFPKFSFAVELTREWQKDVADTPIFSDVVADESGVYSTGLCGKNACVNKKDLDGNDIWSQVVPVSHPTWFPPWVEWVYSPKIAKNESGVYIATAGNLSANLNHGKLYVAKLSPLNGSIVTSQVFSYPGYVAVSGVAIDDTGIYIAGGKSGVGWRVEKRKLDDLSLIFGHNTPPYNGLSCDYWGPRDIVTDGTAVYLGGCRYPTNGPNYVRIEKISANNGVQVWLRDESIKGGVVSMSVDHAGLYVAIDRPFSSGWLTLSTYDPLFDTSALLQKRSIDNGNEVWSRLVDDIHPIALSADNSGLYFGYFSGWVDYPGGDRMIIDKMDRNSGASLGYTTNSETFVAWPFWLYFGKSIINNLILDNSSVYIVGSRSDFSSGRIEKYNKSLQAAIIVDPNPVNTNQNFSADVSASTGNNITQARFLLDDNNQATAPLAADARWSDSYGWTTNATNWDETNKKLSNQIFATAGAKKVWVEISDAVGSKGYASADLTVFAAACVPGCIDTPTTCDKACGGGKKYCTWQYNDCTTTTGFSLNCNLQACPEQNWREVAP